MTGKERNFPEQPEGGVELGDSFCPRLPIASEFNIKNYIINILIVIPIFDKTELLVTEKRKRSAGR